MKIYLNESEFAQALVTKFKQATIVMRQKAFELNKEIYTEKYNLDPEVYQKIIQESANEEAIKEWPEELREQALEVYEKLVGISQELDYSVMEVSEILEMINFTEEELIGLRVVKENLKEDGKEG